MPACVAYHLPAGIRHHIDYITPGVRLIAPSKGVNQIEKRSNAQKLRSRKRSLLHDLHNIPSNYRQFTAPPTATNLSTCDQAITPACIAALYNIPPTNKTEEPVKGNEMGIFESISQVYAQEDLDLFFKNFTPYIPQGTQTRLKFA